MTGECHENELSRFLAVAASEYEIERHYTSRGHERDVFKPLKVEGHQGGEIVGVLGGADG